MEEQENGIREDMKMEKTRRGGRQSTIKDTKWKEMKEKVRNERKKDK